MVIYIEYLRKLTDKILVFIRQLSKISSSIEKQIKDVDKHFAEKDVST